MFLSLPLPPPFFFFFLLPPLNCSSLHLCPSFLSSTVFFSLFSLSFSSSFCLHRCLCCLLLSGSPNFPGGKMNVLRAAGWRRWPGSLSRHWSLGLALLGNCKCYGINWGCILVAIVDRLLAAALCNLLQRLNTTPCPSRIREGSVGHSSSFLMCCWSGSNSKVCSDSPCRLSHILNISDLPAQVQANAISTLKFESGSVLHWDFGDFGLMQYLFNLHSLYGILLPFWL